MASLTPLVKYDPMQPRDDSGRWAATSAGGVSAGVGSAASARTTSAAFDMDLIRKIDSLENMDIDEYIDVYLADELQEMVDELESEYEEMNPGDPDPPDFSYEARNTMRENAFDIYNAQQEAEEMLQVNFSQAYSIDGVGKNGEQWYSEVNEVSVYGGEVQIEGSFYVEGEYAGTFHRVVDENEAYRSRLVIEDEFAGLGIAKQFNAHEEAVYENSGIPQVRISAADLSSGDFNKPPGTYVWATQGYDWNDEPYYVKNAVERYVTTDEYRNLPAPLRRTVDSVIERFDTLNMSDPNYPTPREVSQLGRLPDSDWWAGKAVMAHGGADEQTARQGRSNGSAWDAVKRLGEPARISEGERRSQQARDNIASGGAEEISAALTQFRRMNPQLDLGQEFRIIDGIPVPILPSNAKIEQLLGI